VPIAGEPRAAAARDDRIAVTIGLAGHDAESQTLRDAARGVPASFIELADLNSLGAEFFRWEVATTAAGILLGINPFDEPNVQQAKDATRALLEVYLQRQQLPMPEPVASLEGVRLSLSSAAQEGLDNQDPLTFLRLARQGDYVCILTYAPPDDPTVEAVVDELRRSIGERTGCATMFGYGPRYLHSTGQLHKGGPNTGVFLVVAGSPDDDLPIPDEGFTFGVLEMAQAIGDFQSLDRAGRRALFVHLPGRALNRLDDISHALLAAL
jgi:hypothetical protein